MFTNVRFLKQVQKQTQSYKTVKNWLILLSRLFAIAFLVFAFAQPFKQIGNIQDSAKDQLIAIYVDNSYSMNNANTSGQLFAGAKEKAREIIKAYEPADRFFLFTNFGSVSGRHSLSRANALSKLNQINIEPLANDIPSINKRISYTNEQFGPIDVTYLLSDFQQKSISTPFADSNLNIKSYRLETQKLENISIDSVWLESPIINLNETLKFTVAISNYGLDEIAENNLSLYVNGKKSSVLGFEIDANSKKSISLGFTPQNSGWQQAVLRIEDHPIAYDNALYFSFYVKEKSNVVSIFEDKPNQYIKKVYELDEFYNLKSINRKSIQLEDIKSADLILLNALNNISTGLSKQLKDFVAAGGTLAIIPNTKEGEPAINEFCNYLNTPTYKSPNKQKLKVSSIQSQHPLYKDVFDKIPKNPDFPSISQYFSFENANTLNSNTLMSLNNRGHFILETRLGKGKVFQFAVPFDMNWSNFPEHALFVPTMLKLAMMKSNNLPFSYTIEKENYAVLAKNLNLNQSMIELIKEKQSWKPVITPMAGATYLDLGTDLDAGTYSLMQNDSLMQYISLNQKRTESETHFLSDKELDDYYANTNYETLDKVSVLSKTIKENRFGRRFWKWCVIITLVFITIEILLLRLWPKKIAHS